jgi:ubiquinol-cytochrome c reductase cytochrome b subunit
MHTVGVSSNTINEFEYFSKNLNLTTLSPYYVVKDYFCFLVTEFFLIYLICYYPERFTNPVNYIPADLIKTPSHIIPEWYFLPLYAILKIIPNKELGILIMLFSLLFPFFLPFIYSFRGKLSLFYKKDINFIFVKIVLDLIEYLLYIFFFSELTDFSL